MSEKHVLSFDEFRRLVSDTLDVAEVALKPETHFLNDLAIDSLKIVELMLQLEKRLGKRVPSDAAWEMLTVGDAYGYYVNHTRGQVGATET